MSSVWWPVAIRYGFQGPEATSSASWSSQRELFGDPAHPPLCPQRAAPSVPSSKGVQQNAKSSRFWSQCWLFDMRSKKSILAQLICSFLRRPRHPSTVDAGHHPLLKGLHEKHKVKLIFTPPHSLLLKENVIIASVPSAHC